MFWIACLKELHRLGTPACNRSRLTLSSFAVTTKTKWQTLLRLRANTTCRCASSNLCRSIPGMIGREKTWSRAERFARALKNDFRLSRWALFEAQKLLLVIALRM